MKSKAETKRTIFSLFVVLGLLIFSALGIVPPVGAQIGATATPIAFAIPKSPGDEELAVMLSEDLEKNNQDVPAGYTLEVDHVDMQFPWLMIAYYFVNKNHRAQNETIGIGHFDGFGWVVISDANPNFDTRLSNLPPTLLREDAKRFFRKNIPGADSTILTAYYNHRLPWQGGVSYKVTTGVGGHSSPVEHWAYDFAMANGTEIWASYSGTVAYVTDPYGSGACDPNLANYGNRVVVNNDDGTASLYLHLQQNGSRVSVGQRVNRGDLIGLSGNSGYVCPTGSGYHLHFQVQLQGASWWTQSQQIIFDPNGELAVGSWPVSGNYRNSGGCNPNSDQVALYVDANYGGTCVVKGIGNYPNPGSLGIANDSISSIKVGGNVKLTLCRDDNYASACETFQGDDSNLSDNGIGDNQVSSAKVETRNTSCSPNADQVALYADPNYSGSCVVKGIGEYSNPGAMGISNDSLSSVKVGGNVKLTLCKDDNYSGGCETFTGDDSNLSDNSIGNDQASSAKVETRNPCTNGATYAPLQPGYNSCASEGGTCAFSGQASVAYGANSCYFYQTLTSSVGCNNSVFGDPISGTAKACYAKILVPAYPDLVPFPRSGRLDPVMVSSVPNTTTNDTLYAGQPIYFDWGYKNIGSVDVNANYYVDLYVDDHRFVHYPFTWLGADMLGGFDDWMETWSTSGWHTVKLVVDPDNTVQESDETNNEWSASFYWQSPPTTKKTFLSAAVYDGYLLESSETSNLGGTLNPSSTTLRLGDDAARKQYRSILSFDTGASLPDTAIITKVTLKLRQQGIVGGGNPVTTFQGFIVDMRKGTFGTSALQVADWQATANKTYGPFTPTLTGGWYTFNLTTAKAYINKLATGSGLTQIRLRFQLDDNNNTIANYLSLYSGDAGAASRPQLIIEYYVP